MKKPYKESVLSENTLIRGFSIRTPVDQLTWHRDRDDRTIVVIEGIGWKFQRDNKLPVILESGDKLSISAGAYHRLIKGSSNLIIAIVKEGKKKLSKKQKKIAKASPPPDEITGSDFEVLRRKNVDELARVALKMRSQHDRDGYTSGIYENEEDFDEDNIHMTEINTSKPCKKIKVTRRQLIKLIKEAVDPITVKTVS